MLKRFLKNGTFATESSLKVSQKVHIGLPHGKANWLLGIQ